MSNQLLQIISDTIREEHWPSLGESLIVGMSGGPDSVALAHLVHDLNEIEKRGWNIHLAHLNHHLRGEHSGSDASFVQKLAHKQGWGITVENAAIADCASENGLSLEEAARNARYLFFERVLEKTGGTVVATAHHANDHAETILHRIIRGTGLRGLAGIPVCRSLNGDSNYRVIRPMLSVSRTQILVYLLERDIDFCIDHTNEGTDFTRNRIRNELIPHLQSNYNPAARQALIKLAEQTGWMNELLQETTEDAFNQSREKDSDTSGVHQVVLNTPDLLNKPKIIQTEVVRRAVAEIGAGQKRLSFEHYVSIVDLAARNVSGKKLELPDGLMVAYDHKRLQFSCSNPVSKQDKIED